MNKVLIPTFFSNYGGSVFVLLKSADILKQKYTVVVKAPLKEADIQNISIPATIKRREQIKLSFKFLKHFIKELFWITKEKFDIIYVHDYPSFYIYGLIAKILSIKVIWHVHDGETKKINRKINFYLSDKRIYIAKFQIRNFDRQYCYIPNFIENSNLEKKLNELKNIVIAGSICDNKNQKFGIELIKYFKNKRLYLFGSILEKDYFDSLEIDNKKVFYKGFRDKKEILKFADIIFMPSREEAQPLIFLEALANRIPVLVPDIDAVKEVAKLIDYEKFLYKSGDLKDCILKLNQLESITDKELDKIQREVLTNFSLESFEKKLLKCFRDIP